MQKINTTHAVDNSFVDEDLQHGIYATELSASFMNAVQGELCAILERFEIELDDNDNEQLADLLENPLKGIFEDVKLRGIAGTVELIPGKIEVRSSGGTTDIGPTVIEMFGPGDQSTSMELTRGGIRFVSRVGATEIGSSRVTSPNVETPNVEAEYIGKRVDTQTESYEDLKFSSDINADGNKLYGLGQLVSTVIGNNNGNTQMNGSFVFGASGLCMNFLTYQHRNNLLNLPVVGGTRVTFVNTEIPQENDFEVKFYSRTGIDSYAVIRKITVPYGQAVELICIGQYNDSNGVPRRIWAPYGRTLSDAS